MADRHKGAEQVGARSYALDSGKLGAWNGNLNALSLQAVQLHCLRSCMKQLRVTTPQVQGDRLQQWGKGQGWPPLEKYLLQSQQRLKFKIIRKAADKCVVDDLPSCLAWP